MNKQIVKIAASVIGFIVVVVMATMIKTELKLIAEANSVESNCIAKLINIGIDRASIVTDNGRCGIK